MDSEGPLRVQQDRRRAQEKEEKEGGGRGGVEWEGKQGPTGCPELAQLIPRASCALVIRSTL